MKALLQKLLGDKNGASAAEYALILAVMGVAVAVAFQALGGAIATSVDTATVNLTPQ